jgi:hypothetical protein
MKPAQNRTFVIGGPSAIQLLSVSRRGQLKGFCVPTIFLGSWLDIKVAVDDQSFFLWVIAKLAKDHRWEFHLGSIGPGNKTNKNTSRRKIEITVLNPFF